MPLLRMLRDEHLGRSPHVASLSLAPSAKGESPLAEVNAMIGLEAVHEHADVAMVAPLDAAFESTGRLHAEHSEARGAPSLDAVNCMLGSALALVACMCNGELAPALEHASAHPEAAQGWVLQEGGGIFSFHRKLSWTPIGN